MAPQPTVRLNDGRQIPQLGFGVSPGPGSTPTAPAGTRSAWADVIAAAVRTALETGYRALDTASIYGTEPCVAEGLAASGVPRSEVFITTKLFSNEQGYDQTLRACDASLRKLGVDYLDLYLIHNPARPLGRYVDSWRAMIRLQQEGKIRSIGVSNFGAGDIRKLIAETGVTPALNQVPVNAIQQQRRLRATHAKLGVATEAWGPIAKGALLEHPVIQGLARKHRKTTAQVALRWHIDQGLIAIPMSKNPSRIAENFDIFDFRLDAADLAAIAALDDPANPWDRRNPNWVGYTIARTRGALTLDAGAFPPKG